MTCPYTCFPGFGKELEAPRSRIPAQGHLATAIVSVAHPNQVPEPTRGTGPFCFSKAAGRAWLSFNVRHLPTYAPNRGRNFET